MSPPIGATRPVMLATTLDLDAAGHVALALRLYLDRLAKQGGAVPPAVVELQQIIVERFTDRHEPSRTVSRPPVGDDDLAHGEWFSPKAAAHLTGLSLSTVERAIRSGQLTSVKVGRSRRIHRTAIDTYMTTDSKET